MDAPILGIDLGTTFSAAAYVDEKTGLPTAIETSDGTNTLASVVEIYDGVIKTVGAAAMSRWIVDEQHVIRWIKRAMGNPEYRFQGLSAPEISAAILRTLKADAKKRFGVPIQRAVVTCPAYFGSVEKEATLKAGELAGLIVDQLVEEPTAAAIHFGVNHMNDGEQILVCDLGGGTYDATILHYEKGVFKQLETTGDRKMGGHDWTTDLVTLVQDRFFADTNLDIKDDLMANQVLYEQCEKAKRQYLHLDSVTIPCSSQGQSRDIPVDRGDFEAATEWRMQHLVGITTKALEKASLGWSSLHWVLLVGGSSRLRRMALALEEASGIKPQVSAEPDLSVAYGAASVAAGKVRRKPRTGLVVSQTTTPVLVMFERSLPRSLGTRTIVWEAGKPRITNALLIPHGTPVPEAGLTKSRDDFEISANGQQSVDVPVVEFESDADFELRGNYRFTCARTTSRGDRIKVTFHYDKNAISRVEAVDVQSGNVLSRTEVAYQDPDLDNIVPPRNPRFVVFTIDVSASMDSNGKLLNAQQAVIQNAQLLLAGGALNQVAVVSFSSDASVVCEPTSNLAEVERCVRNMTTQDTTAMDRGLSTALDVALAAPAGMDREIVLVTDGMPDDRQRALDAAQRVPQGAIDLCMLGVGSADVDLAFLQQMCPRAQVVDAAANISQVVTNLLSLSGSGYSSTAT